MSDGSNGPSIAMNGEPSTIVDVLENFFDGLPTPAQVGRLTETEWAEFGEEVRRHYSLWVPEPVAGDHLRVHAGGLGETAPDELPRILLGLLFAHSATVYDPIEYGVTHRQHVSVDDLQGRVATVVALAPLIRERIVVPIPMDRLRSESEAAIEATARRLITPQEWDFSRGEGDFVRDVLRSSMDPFGGKPMERARWWSEDVVLAASARARYLPPPEGWLARCWRRALEATRQPLRAADCELLVEPALHVSKLPYLRETNLSTLSHIRLNDGDFEDWRASLRSASRTIRTLPGDADFATDANGALRDLLEPSERRLTKSQDLREPLLAVQLGAGGLLGLGLATGTPPEEAIAALGITTLARVIAQTLVGGSSSQQPQDAVLGILISVGVTEP